MPAVILPPPPVGQWRPQLFVALNMYCMCADCRHLTVITPGRWGLGRDHGSFSILSTWLVRRSILLVNFSIGPVIPSNLVSRTSRRFSIFMPSDSKSSSPRSLHAANEIVRR